MIRHATIARSMMLTSAAAMAFAGSAQAAPVSLLATQDTRPGYTSTFSLTFTDYGLTRQANLSTTDFTLQVDDQPSPTGTATFTSYYQTIEPLYLPNPTPGEPDISTGPLTVEIVLGSAGASSYDPLTGNFTTTETYRIHYTEDLSAFGLTHPDRFVEFASTSTGLITFDTTDSGTIAQNWHGLYDLNGLTIEYSCAVNTVFTPEPAAAGVLAFAGLALRRARRRCV